MEKIRQSIKDEWKGLRLASDGLARDKRLKVERIRQSIKDERKTSTVLMDSFEEIPDRHPSIRFMERKEEILIDLDLWEMFKERAKPWKGMKEILKGSYGNPDYGDF